MIRVGIVGASGYSGALALEILLNHPHVRVTYVGAQNSTGPVDEICPRLNKKTNLICEVYDVNKAVAKADIFLLAVPHTSAMGIVPGLLKFKKKVIDLSADYRLNDAKFYQAWYQHEHTDPKNIKHAVYGLPELYRADIKKSHLVANPGCYPTAAILGLAPLMTAYGTAVESIIIDAKSGVSGAGKKLLGNLMFCEVNENFKAYKVLSHQHTPEINLYLSALGNRKIKVAFVPHLLPINQGILETIYVRMKTKVTKDNIESLYKKFYKTEPFVRLMKSGIQPEVKNVSGTNYCDIGIEYDAAQQLCVVTSVIDNLMKGAASQAIQNMNIMCGFSEDEGL